MNEQQMALENLISESNARMENFNAQLANAAALAKKYAKTIKQQNTIISKQEAVIKEEKRKEEEQKKNESITGGSNPSYSTNVSGSDVVDYACQFVGNPYVFGGTSLTKGCDCSYFVKACYGNFGITLPRTSYQQRSVGQAVSYSNAQAGDIICYAGHVAIYMGDGKIVHAANAKQGICYGTATYRTIIAVRRVL
jgi:cell wall-associated NlpC family hydrolase